MKRSMCRLDNLCIEIIGKNINKLSRIPKENWSLRFFDCLGEKIIISSLSNSNEKLDEKSYEFIFANFNIKKFRIKFNENENIKYYNFLNNKKLEYLEIRLIDNIKVKEIKQNFRLTVDKLYLLCSLYNFNVFAESLEFFSKLKVRKKLKITSPPTLWQPDRDFEKLLLTILKNTSKKIESIFIEVQHLTIVHVESFVEEIKERKNLKELIIDSDEKKCHLLSVNLMQTIFFNNDLNGYKKNFSDSCFIKNSDCSIESFKAIESLTVRDNLWRHKTIKMFELINKLNLSKIRKLCVSLLKEDYFPKEYLSLFQRCSKTEHLELIKGKFFEFPLKPFTENFKILKLNDVTFDNKIQCKNFDKFIFNSTLTEISFSDVEIYEHDFFETFELFQNTLTSFTFGLKYSKNEKEILLSLSKTIKNFKKLEIFRLNGKELTLEISENICESLLSSSKSLRNLTILGYGENKNIENCPNFFELLKNCEKLDHIHIDFLFEKKTLIELFLILKKFKDILRYIKCRFNVERKIPKEYLELLSECCRLEYIDPDQSAQFDEDIPENPEEYLKNSKYTLFNTNVFNKKKFSAISVIGGKALLNINNFLITDGITWCLQDF